MKKIITFLLIVSTLVCSFGITAFADDGITPYFENSPETDSSFKINSSGLAQINVKYRCYDETFASAKVTVELQKRNLLVFWKDVTSWEETSFDTYFASYYSYQVNSGTYRVKITYEIFATDGTSEVIEETLKYTY